MQGNMRKILSHITGDLTGFQDAEHLDGYIPKVSYKLLGTVDDKEFYSFDTTVVIPADNDEKFQVKIYDVTDPADKAYLESVKDKLWVVREELHDIKSKLTMDLFTVLTNLAVGDKYTIDTLTALKKEHDDYLSNLGF